MQLRQDGRLKSVEDALTAIRIKLMELSTGSMMANSTRYILPEQAFGLPDKLSVIVNKTAKIYAEQSVLSSLHFKVIRNRHDTIPEAHRTTFKWVFKSAHRPVNIDGAPLHDWLSSQSGIFWVSGKAGSGKSTLMKYLSSHRQTSQLLNTWAGELPCISADCYFWSMGSQLQKSQEGLLRSLLFEVLRQCPDLIPRVCQQRWATVNSHGIKGSANSWSLEELRTSLQRLSSANLSRRFCFFVDGLDEYTGDLVEIVRILEALCSTGQIKICVSSRPWNIFEDAFGRVSMRKIYVQDLTREDIRTYTQSKLQGHPTWRLSEAQREQYNSLVLEIVEKAQGVFLWVFLVVKSLLDGLTNGDSLSILRGRIRELPADLEQYFKHMLQSVDKIYYSHMVITFRVALHASKPLSLMLYSFLDDIFEKYGYALELPVKGMDNYELSGRNAQMRRRINGRCKGLLEIHQDVANVDYLGYRVEFLHRTVRDFLATKEMSELLTQGPEAADIHAIIIQCFIALIKSLPPKESYLKEGGALSELLRDSFHYAYVSDIDYGHVQIDLLDELESTLDSLVKTSLQGVDWYQKHAKAGTSGSHPMCTPFLQLAAQSGLAGYVKDRIYDDTITSRGVLIDDLLQSVFTTTPFCQVDQPDLSGVLSNLLTLGDECTITRLGKLWENVLNTSIPALCGTTTPLESETDIQRHCRVMEVMLNHGAPPDIPIATTAATLRVLMDEIKPQIYRSLLLARITSCKLPNAVPIHKMPASVSSSSGLTRLPWVPLLFYAWDNENLSPATLTIYLQLLSTFIKSDCMSIDTAGRLEVWDYLIDSTVGKIHSRAQTFPQSTGKAEFEASMLKAFLTCRDDYRSPALSAENVTRYFHQRRLSRPILEAMAAAQETNSANEQNWSLHGTVAWLWSKSGGMLTKGVDSISFWR